MGTQAFYLRDATDRLIRDTVDDLFYGLRGRATKHEILDAIFRAGCEQAELIRDELAQRPLPRRGRRR